MAFVNVPHCFISRYVVSPPRNTEEDGDDELAKVSAATSLVTMNSDALLSWIQQQLDRSIAKHLEKGLLQS